MRIHILLPFVLLLATGCTHQRVVAPADVDSVIDLNQRAGQHNVTVTLSNGVVYYGRALQMAADSTSWLVEDTQEVTSVATDDVVAVEIQNRGRGALEGLATGAVAGTLTGVALGLIVGDDPPCEDGWCLFRTTAEEKAQLFGVLLGTTSALGGLIRGAVRGSRDVYQVDARDTVDSLAQDLQPSGDRGVVRIPEK